MSGLPVIRQEPKRGILSVNILTSALVIMRASSGVPVDIGVSRDLSQTGIGTPPYRRTRTILTASRHDFLDLALVLPNDLRYTSRRAVRRG